MSSRKHDARVAGWWYLISGFSAPYSLIYLPGIFMVMPDATATADKIRHAEPLFRFGITAELMSATLFIFVGFAMYRLFKDVNRHLATLLLTLLLLFVPISYVNELNRIAALMLSNGANLATTADQHRLDVLVMAFLHLHLQGLLLAQVFWGLWLFPFAILVFRSGFLPKILGVLLFFAGLAMEAAGGIGEGGTMLWLVILGAKETPVPLPLPA
jgi:hypothetical protein